MIQYENISAYFTAKSRLRRPWRGYPHISNSSNQDANRVTMFTTEVASQTESKQNLEHVLEFARSIQAPLVVIKPTLIQIAGHADLVDLDPLVDSVWKDQWWDWWNHNQGAHFIPEWQQHAWPNCMVIELMTYGAGYFVREKQTGVYDVMADDRVSGRRQQIELLWAHGFPSRRGRPVSIPRQRWCGSVQEILELTQLRQQYVNRRLNSEVAAKICSAWSSINRYVAWPGAW